MGQIQVPCCITILGQGQATEAAGHGQAECDVEDRAQRQVGGGMGRYYLLADHWDGKPKLQREGGGSPLSVKLLPVVLTLTVVHNINVSITSSM